MKEKVRFLGLDVHAETIAVAIAEPDGEVRSLGTIANRTESIRKLVKKLGPAEQLRACYEAGPTGYVLYWQLAELGVACEVIAPTLVPMKAGDRVKTDRRDAERLARSYRSGDLTAVWVPDEGSEALRDLVRAREAAKQDQLRARHRLSKFLLRTGQRPALGVKAWTQAYLAWVQADSLHTGGAGIDVAGLSARGRAHGRSGSSGWSKRSRRRSNWPRRRCRKWFAGLQALRGIAQISAVTIVAELGKLSRFESARQLMGYSGAVPSEESSGKRTRRGSITKTGNAHLRRIADRSGLELPAAAARRPCVAQATRRRIGRDQGDRLEGATPIAQALHEAVGGRKRSEKDHHRSGTRTAGLHLGHRDQGGSGQQTANGGLTKSNSKSSKSKNFPKNEKAKTLTHEQQQPNSRTEPAAARSKHEGESSSCSYATGSAGLATLVRGSSRRITIMRFRPANIRLINRRSNLPRLLLALSSKNGKNNNTKTTPRMSQRLTGSLHIRDCLVTVASVSAQHEADLAKAEMDHHCNQWHLQRSKRSAENST